MNAQENRVTVCPNIPVVSTATLVVHFLDEIVGALSHPSYHSPDIMTLPQVSRFSGWSPVPESNWLHRFTGPAHRRQCLLGKIFAAEEIQTLRIPRQGRPICTRGIAVPKILSALNTAILASVVSSLNPEHSGKPII